MAGSKTFMIENAREELLSSDLTRIGKLAAREQQNADMAKNIRADFFVPGTIDDFGASNRGMASKVIPSALVAPSLDGKAGSFDMDIGAGEVEVITSDTADPDVSDYQVARWEDQTITWPSEANPDGSWPSIATICAMPTNEQDDQVSRNILLDPATRAFQPQNIYKTSNPSAVFVVVAGTAASVPFPPTVPTNFVALFDLYIPAGVTGSSQFLISRRCWRRVEFPGSSQHGIVKGCVIDLYETPQLPTGVVHRLLIDGELLTWSSNVSLGVVSDTVHGPGSAPADSDMPVYLYLCGGRHWPWAYAAPVLFVQSLTVPDSMGYPTAALGYAGSTIPRNAAVYVGIAFRGAGGTVNVPAGYDGDWIYSLNPVAVYGVDKAFGFKQAVISSPATSYTSLVLAGIPATSTMMDLALAYLASGTHTVLVATSNADAAVFTRLSAVTDLPFVSTRVKMPIVASLWYKAADASGTLLIMAAGWNMNIPRLGS